MIVFGSGRLLLLPLLLFFLAPLLFYSPSAGLVLIVVAVLVIASTARQRREVESPVGFPTLAPADPRAFDDVRGTAGEDILGLADEIRSLDLDIEMPGVSPEARADYMHAVDQYDRAKAALDRARLAAGHRGRVLGGRCGALRHRLDAGSPRGQAAT